MPVPKRKHSRARKNKRSANKGIKPKAIAACQTCQASVSPHQVCFQCGHYKGVKILRTKTDRIHERTQVRQAEQARLEAMQTKSEQAGSQAGEEKATESEKK